MVMKEVRTAAVDLFFVFMCGLPARAVGGSTWIVMSVGCLSANAINHDNRTSEDIK